MIRYIGRLLMDFNMLIESSNYIYCLADDERVTKQRQYHNPLGCRSQ